MKVDPNGPAYPHSITRQNDDGSKTVTTYHGLTARLAIAAQIMAAQCVNGFVPYTEDNQIEHSPQFRAERSLEWADALIAAHNEDSK